MNLGFEFQRTAAKPKRDSGDAPTQERMGAGIKPAQRKAPTADQKRVRRQMTKKAYEIIDASTLPGPSEADEYWRGYIDGEDGVAQDASWIAAQSESYQQGRSDGQAGVTSKYATLNTAPEENTMSYQQREAEILRAMSKASLREQQRLSFELESLRAQRTASTQAARDIDLSDTVIRDTLTPVRVHERHTASTDWLNEVQVGGGDYDHAMRTEATLWVKTRHEAVLADREEFAEQAKGMARRLAGAYGTDAPAAAQVFIETAARLRTMASDQNGNAESTVTDYETKADQDPLYSEDWPGADATGVHPPMPGAGEAGSYGSYEWEDARRAASRKTATHGYDNGDPIGGGWGPKDVPCQECGKPADDPVHLFGTDGRYSASRKTASAPDGSVSTCAICGKTIQCMDYAWYHLSADGPVDWATHGPQTYPGSEVIRPSASKTASDEGKKCSECGTYNDPEADLCEGCNKPLFVQGSRRTASDEQTCSVCGDKIAKDPSSEDPSTYHHDNGEKHDHEAKPSGSTSEARRKVAEKECSACHGTGRISQGSPGIDLGPGFPEFFDCPTCKGSGKTAARKTAISLTNVGIEGDNGVGTDPNGNRVKFRLSEQDRADLKAVLYSDLAVNFSGVDVEESDIIKDASRKTAADHSVQPPAGREVPEGYEEAKCQVCGEKIVGNARVWLHATASKTASESVEVSVIPECDICKYDLGTSGVPAAYDGATTMGPWANMCEAHFSQVGIGLGTGRGQRLVLRASKTASEQKASPGEIEHLDSGAYQRSKCQNCGDTIRRRSGIGDKWQHAKTNSQFCNPPTFSSKTADVQNPDDYLVHIDSYGEGYKPMPEAEDYLQQMAGRTAAGPNTFSLSDAKNEEGEWIMSPEEIRAEMNYDPSEYEEEDWYRDASRRSANVWGQNARVANEQDGSADSSLPNVEVTTATDVMWPVELEAEVLTNDGAAKGGTPTPGANGYPQPTTASVIPAQGRIADFRARVQAGLVRMAETND